MKAASPIVLSCAEICEFALPMNRLAECDGERIGAESIGRLDSVSDY